MHNLLKRFTAVALSTLVLLSSVATCFAESINYTISEIDNMAITLPNTMTGITRESSDTDKYFSVFGLNYEDTMNKIKSNDIYFQAMNSDTSLTLTVSMTKTDQSKNIRSYKNLDSSKLAEIKDNFLKQEEYQACTADEAGSITWLVFQISVVNDGKNIKAYQANTVYDGMSVNVTLQRNGGNVNTDDYAMFSSILSQIAFKKGENTLPIVGIIIGIVLILLILVLAFIFIRKLKKHSKKAKNNKVLDELSEKYQNGAAKIRDSIKNKHHIENKDDSEQYEDISSEKPESYSDISNSSNLAEEHEEHEEPQNNEGAELTEENKDLLLSDIDDESIDDILKNYGTARKKRIEEARAAEIKEAEKYILSPEDVEKKISQKDDFDDSILSSVASQEVKIYERPNPETKQDDESKENKEDKSDTETKEVNDDTIKVYDTKENATEDNNAKAEVEKKKSITDTIIGNVGNEDDEQEDFNDEELLRQQVKKTKFDDSDDFFEEAPHKGTTIKDAEEIINAPDYDVINEVEKKVQEVEQSGIKRENKETFEGVKNFFTHMGYFVSNMHKMIKHKRAVKKRRKIETQRREREYQRKQRAINREQSRNSDGLVQVHHQNRPRKPSKTVNRRTQNSNNRRPQTRNNHNGNRR